ncbi:hypothetical protein ACF0H5_008866 [Mactra antiquata]
MFKRKKVKTVNVAPFEDSKIKKNVAFTIEFDESNRREMPSKLIDRLNTPKPRPHDQITYTDEESMLIAEIMRQSTLQDIKDKANKLDHKIFDAGRRRMCLASIRAQSKNRIEKESLCGVIM